ncbi:MAG: CHRD domain-containing protein [Mycobacteriales bacterium]
MLDRRSAVLVAVPVLAAGVFLATAGVATAATTTVTARASGANEVPTPGPQGATGRALFTLDTSTGRICYQASTSGLSNIAAAHIHSGAAGVAGPVVVPLEASRINSGSQTCTTADPALVAKIAASPASFYFNVHTPQFSAGAVRGQLAAGGPSGANAGSGGAAGDSGPSAWLVVALLAGGVLTVVSARRLSRR